MWILIFLLSTGFIIITGKLIRVIKRVKKLNAFETQSIQLLKKHEADLINQGRMIKSNSDIADKYIEQLHTKITELEVTLQNIVNKK